MGYPYPNLAYKDFKYLMKNAKEEYSNCNINEIGSLLSVIDNFNVDLRFINRIKSVATVVGNYSKDFELSSDFINQGIDTFYIECEERLNAIKKEDNKDLLSNILSDFDKYHSNNKLLDLKMAVDKSLIFDCKRKLFKLQDAVLDMLQKIDNWMEKEVFIPAKVPFYIDDKRKENEIINKEM